ncbi:MAG: class I adenylate-forming enzyme family protein [Acidocella sp.]|nr:class I adenylate-forming enzyme family protein [Acidocella sp.]
MNSSWRNISDAIFHYAEHEPDRAALIAGDRQLSYRELALLVSQTSVYLKNIGIKLGHPVAIAMRNNAENIILTLAAFRIGAVLIALPAEMSDQELAARVSAFKIIASFTDPDGPASSAPVAVRVGPTWLADISRLSGDVTLAPRVDAQPHELRLIIVSSGSTGIPKGILTTQEQRMLRAATYRSFFGDRWTVANPGNLLLPAPPSMSFYGQFLVIQLLLGGTVVLLPKFDSGVDLANAIAAYSDVICPIVPNMARNFIACAPADSLLFPNVRALIPGGLPLAGHEKLALVRRVSPHIHEIYGSGGFGAFAHLGPDEILAHSNSVGRAVSAVGNQVELVDWDDKPVAPGVEGRLRVRGTHVSLGFFNPEDNARGAERFVDGWYYPGDVLQRDEAGFLYMRGRSDDAFISGDLTVYPPELEDVITRHPDIEEAVVVGRPNGANGVDLVGFLVVRHGLDHEAVVAYCMANLPPAKCPKMVFYLDAIPRTGNGKIDRPALKQAAMRLI